MKTVTTHDIQRQFGRIREEAQREPIAITNHGRESLVLVSAVEYKRLKALDTRRAGPVSDLSEEEIEGIVSGPLPEESYQAQKELETRDASKN